MSAQKIHKSEHQKIKQMYESGMTYQQIADIYHVTRQYIGAIAKSLGLCARLGGQSKLVLDRKNKEKERKDKLCMDRYGLDYDTYKAMRNACRKNPIEAYESQKNNAKTRGIDFNFTFSEWWSVWEESGRWHLRGKTSNNFCMSRFNDTGAYELGNVAIKTCRENIREVRERESKERKNRGASV